MLLRSPADAYPILAAGTIAELFGIHIGLILTIPGGLFELALAFWLLKGSTPRPTARSVTTSSVEPPHRRPHSFRAWTKEIEMPDNTSGPMAGKTVLVTGGT